LDKNINIKSKNYKLFKALLSDSIAKYLIFGGGIITLIAVIGILAFVVIQSLPLFKPVSSKNILSHKTENKILVSGFISNTYYYYIDSSGTISIFEIKSNKNVYHNDLGVSVNDAIKSKDDKIVLLENISGELYKIVFNHSVRNDEVDKFFYIDKVPDVRLGNPKLVQIKRSVDGNYFLCQINNSDTLCTIKLTDKTTDPLDSSKIFNTFRIDYDTTLGVVGKILTDSRLENLLITTSNNVLYFKRDDSSYMFVNQIKLSGEITNIDFSNSEQSVICATDRGVFLLEFINSSDVVIPFSLKFSKRYESGNLSAKNVIASNIDKSFFVIFEGGYTELYYQPFDKGVINIANENGHNEINSLSITKNGKLALTHTNNQIKIYEIEKSNIDVNISTLFSKVKYEGYLQSDYIWQSSGGTDDYESKYSLIPLITGTLKGTIFAMIFAVPLAVLAALYTSLYLNDKLKNYIKNFVEIMTAIPTVVIGFIVSLWLAPILEFYVPVIITFLIIFPLIMILGIIILNFLKLKIDNKFYSTKESIINIISVATLLLTSYFIADTIIKSLVDNDFVSWLNVNMGIHYEQRNGIIVGFALGISIIPMIFTLSEDSINIVPKSFIMSSYALGANNWQTAYRVILPYASSGIFSVIMLAFARAIGETMIVLMVAGNTPINDWSLFTGLRSLSANIAIEIPEAPLGGTLYRILFLSASLLFVFTFIINTMAELIRMKLKRKTLNKMN